MQSLQWYVNRLGRMSAAELTWRVAQAARTSTERWVSSTRLAAPAPNLAARDRNYVHENVRVDAARYIAQADELIAGRFQVFDLEDCPLGNPPEWNRDPLTGRLAPLRHAAALDHRDAALVGNIKYLWEPNRHLHLPQLAQAYLLSGDYRYALAVKAHVSSWIEQCPCDRGPNWSSSLELAIRLINWSITWQWLGGAGSPLFADAGGRSFRDRWLESVYQHARTVSRNLSRFSSANNHLIGEAAGVWIASTTWSYWPQLRRWGSRCKRILAAEALAQNAPDGGNREQAFAYQQFVVDFLLLAGLAARAAGEDFASAYWQRLETMLEFIASMTDAGGHVPMIGDADDGQVVKLSPEPDFDNYRSLLATGAVLFDRPDFAGKAGGFDEKTQWLLGANAVSRCEERVAHAATRVKARRAFAQSGYYLMGDGFDTPQEIRLLVDAGPLGYLSIAAHGHADALSVVLSVAGREILVDPGTYTYHDEPEWRRYFRGTRAHNTVLVDERDQSRQSGDFMWSRHAVARCLEFDAGSGRQRFAGEHDGYRALSDPVTHRREIEYDVENRVFTISDTLQCAASHTVCRHWHFAESVEPEMHQHELRVHAGAWLIRIMPVDVPAEIHHVRGGSPAQGGWISRRFGRKEPASTVAWCSDIHGTTTLRTRIHCEPVQAPAHSCRNHPAD